MDKINVEAWVKRNMDGTLEIMGRRAFVDGEFDDEAVDFNLIPESLKLAEILRLEVTEENKELKNALLMNYSIMCLCTSVEQTLKRIAKKYASEHASEVLSKNENYFQNPKNANTFFKNKIGIFLTGCFNWDNLKLGFEHSHSLRHVSPLNVIVNERRVVKNNEQPLHVRLFYDDFEKNVKIGSDKLMKNIEKL